MTDTPKTQKEVELPPLNEDCSDADFVLRAARWTKRVYASNHAGIDCEWDLIRRERQLLQAKREIANLQGALTELRAFIATETAQHNKLREHKNELVRLLERLVQPYEAFDDGYELIVAVGYILADYRNLKEGSHG